MYSAMAHLAASGPCCGRYSRRVPLMACCMKRTAMRKPKSSPLKRVNLQATRGYEGETDQFGKSATQ